MLRDARPENRDLSRFSKKPVSLIVSNSMIGIWSIRNFLKDPTKNVGAKDRWISFLERLFDSCETSFRKVQRCGPVKRLNVSLARKAIYSSILESFLRHHAAV